MTGKVIATVVVVLIVIIGGAWVYNSTFNNTSMSEVATTTPADLGLVIGSTTPPATAADASGATSEDYTPPGAANPAASATTNTNLAKVMQATLHTSMGDITFEFLPNQAPNTVANFIKLASAGFYDGTKFHRVIKGFMDQGGDPLTKDDSKMALWGTGGPGYQFNDEIGPNNSNAAFTVSMANSGPNTNGSQFFINAVDNSASLNSGYTEFAKVTAGQDVVTAINNTPTDGSDRPLTPVVISSITLK